MYNLLTYQEKEKQNFKYLWNLQSTMIGKLKQVGKQFEYENKNTPSEIISSYCTCALCSANFKINVHQNCPDSPLLNWLKWLINLFFDMKINAKRNDSFTLIFSRVFFYFSGLLNFVLEFFSMISTSRLKKYPNTN